MAQRAGATTAKHRPATGRSLGRLPGSKNEVKTPPAIERAKPTTRTAIVKSAESPRKATISQAVAKPSKEELRQQIEKLERTVATFRARSCKSVRTAKQAAARIEELEEQLRVQETQALKPEAAESGDRKKPAAAGVVPPEAAVKTPRGRGRTLKRDPGDAVRPGVAVEEPSPMDAEARMAL